MMIRMNRISGKSLTSSDPGFRDDPNHDYDRLRASPTPTQVRDYDCSFVTRHAQVLQGLKHKFFSVDARNASAASYMRRVAGTGVKESLGDAAYEPPLVLLDDPAHRRIRALVSRAFNPNTIEAMRPDVERITSDLLDSLHGREQIDFITDFSAPLPTMVILKMMGLPLEHSAEFKQWSEDILWGYDPDRNGVTQDRLRHAYIGMTRVFRDALKQRRESPGDDLISALVRAREADDSLTELQIISLCTQLMVAGNVTTTDLMGNGIYALASHPVQQRWLAGHLECIADAVEEMLRYDCPITETARIALRDVEFAGCPMHAGDTLTLSLAAANRDPEAFERPHEFDLKRAPQNHLGFGSGIHVCLGAPLARMETQIGLGRFIERFPDFRLDPAIAGYRRALPFFRGFEKLPLLLR
jgi:cytochrome P450